MIQSYKYPIGIIFYQYGFLSDGKVPARRNRFNNKTQWIWGHQTRLINRPIWMPSTAQAQHVYGEFTK